MNSRDRYVLGKIVAYCEQIRGTCEALGNTEAAFAASYIFQNACGMCIIQIGEMAGRLSEEARGAIPQIPWTLIRGMRNTFAHDYGAMDVAMTWATIQSDIPMLRAACEAYLNAQE